MKNKIKVKTKLPNIVSFAMFTAAMHANSTSKSKPIRAWTNKYMNDLAFLYAEYIHDVRVEAGLVKELGKALR